VRLDIRALTAVAIAAATAIATVAAAQHTGHGASMPPTTSAAGKPPAPVSMEELHRNGGVPRGWKFTLPAGDPKAGRELFGKLECNKCHEVKPDFPRGERAAGDVGPELTGMGAHHPAEYFAQSIVDPNAVIVAGTGFVGPDGRSVMPDYRDSLTFNELVDLVAYLKSLGGGAHAHQHGGMPMREQTAGPYRLRVEYHAPGQHAHHHAAGGAESRGHLMAFVTDTATGEPVPYLPVSVVIATAKAAPRTVRLAPMVGDAGFHYGADVAIPQGTTKLTVTVGVGALKTTGAAAGRFGKPVTVSFDWSE
jgi:mono/diheme cytochrome c family protein